jgi:hypothetical protein
MKKDWNDIYMFLKLLINGNNSKYPNISLQSIHYFHYKYNQPKLIQIENDYNMSRKKLILSAQK